MTALALTHQNPGPVGPRPGLPRARRSRGPAPDGLPAPQREACAERRVGEREEAGLVVRRRVEDQIGGGRSGDGVRGEPHGAGSTRGGHDHRPGPPPMPAHSDRLGAARRRPPARGTAGVDSAQRVTPRDRERAGRRCGATPGTLPNPGEPVAARVASGMPARRSLPHTAAASAGRARPAPRRAPGHDRDAAAMGEPEHAHNGSHLHRSGTSAAGSGGGRSRRRTTRLRRPRSRAKPDARMRARQGSAPIITAPPPPRRLTPRAVSASGREGGWRARAATESARRHRDLPRAR